MAPELKLTLYLAGSFLAGAIPFAWLMGRAGGVDIRRVGSGNVGATNLARAKGRSWGIAAFALDALKGGGPVALAGTFGVGEVGGGVSVAAGAAAILGHCFSPFLGFRGGKGVATAAGVLIALSPPIAGGLLLTWGLALAVLKKVGLASSVAALAAAGVGLDRLVRGSDSERALALFLVALAILVLVRHRSNLVQHFSREAS